LGDQCHRGGNQDRGDQSQVQSQVEAGRGGTRGARAMAVAMEVVGAAAAVVVSEEGLYPSGRRGIWQLLHLQRSRDGRK
jgi:hypothetical protein